MGKFAGSCHGLLHREADLLPERTPEAQVVAEVHCPALLGHSLGCILSPVLDGYDQQDADSSMVYDLCHLLY